MKRIILKAKSSVSNGQSEYSIGLRLIKMLYNIFNDTTNINLTMSHYKGENVESLARVDMHYSTLWIRDNYGIFVDQRDLEERGWKTLSLSSPSPSSNLEKTRWKAYKYACCTQDFPSQQTDPSHGYVRNPGRMVFAAKPRERWR